MFLILPLLAGCVRFDGDADGVGKDSTVGVDDSTAPDSDSTGPDDTGTGTHPARRLETGLLYEVYVRSFQDSDGDGIGDLQGLRSRLDYLHDLGVTVVWLMPIFENPGVAGYAITDYLQVESDYGTMDDLVALNSDAAALGIRIALDIPLNHSSVDHPYFVSAASDFGSPWRDRYIFSDTRNDTERWFSTPAGDYFYAFFGNDQPDFDWTSEATHDDFATVIDTWMDLGVGGWRVDAVRQLVEEDGMVSDSPGCHDVMSWFFDRTRDGHDGLVIAEAFFTDDTPGMLAYLGDDDRPETDLLLDAPRSNSAVTTIAQSDAAPLVATIDAEIAAGAERRVVSYYSSHDTDRLPTRVTSEGKRRLLEVLNFTLPGLPMLYYGEEIDLPNGDSQFRQDEPQRTPMPWDDSYNAGFTTGTTWFNLAPGWETRNVEASRADPDSMWSLVKSLRDLRGASVALREGALTWGASDDPTRLTYTVTSGDEFVTVFANLGPDEVDPPVVDGCALVPGNHVGPYGYLVWASDGLCELRVPPNL